MMRQTDRETDRRRVKSCTCCCRIQYEYAEKNNKQEAVNFIRRKCGALLLGRAMTKNKVESNEKSWLELGIDHQ